MKETLQIPTPETLEALIGKELYDIWTSLCQLIEQKYNMEQLWNHGGKKWTYEYKYRKGGKTLCALYAKEQTIGFLVILGKDERAKFESLREVFSNETQKVYDETTTFHDGKWLMFELKDTCFFSAVFIQVLNPMNIAYRKREADKVLATRLALRTHRISYITLIAVILFFAFSFTFSISHEEAVSAFEQNISALALAAQVIPGHIIHITSTVLNIFAVLTAFFGIYLGFHEAIKGIILNLLSRIIDTKKINSRVLTLAICAFIVITLTIWVSFRVSVLVFFQLGSPLYGIVSCLIPFFLIYKVAQLEKLRGFKAWLILLYGILLCLSPLLKLIE